MARSIPALAIYEVFNVYPADFAGNIHCSKFLQRDGQIIDIDRPRFRTRSHINP